MKKLLIVVLAMALMAVIAVPTFAASADEGAKVFASKCAVCHGADGAGKLKGTPDLRSAEIQKKSDAELTSAIANGPKGKEATHAFAKKGLDDATIKSLVAYIRTLKK